MTLRTRLVLITAALSALALVAANAAGLVLLRGYLMDQVDERLVTGQEAGTTVPAERVAQLLEATAVGQAALGGRFGDSTQVFVLDGEGRLLAAQPGEEAAAGPRLPEAGTLAERAGRTFTVPGRGGEGPDWRLSVRETSDGGLVVMAASLAQVEQTVGRLLAIDAAVLGVVLLLLALGAAWLIRLGLRPLTRMEATAAAISGGDFARRVPFADPRTEPGRLGRAMNAMLDRVEREITARRDSERRLRRFLSDASHELRTPLTTIRGFAELSRRGGDPAGALARIEAEARRMGVLVTDLLLLARLDEQPALSPRPLDLREPAADLVRAARAQHPERAISLDGPGPALAFGDPLRVRQILSNLLTNALRHTPPGAAIAVRTATGPGGTAVAEVADTGPGIPPEHASRVFDRLYRADPARPHDGGTGLGLSIAAALARAHGGTLTHAPAEPHGAAFRLTLPPPPPSCSP
ncbi:HAMP domain-containing sensor histidine kinase [Streptomyces sp. DSM 44917]|uniref:histidine kinase n=1 Tax=Streptomyces boetiae TaxID=3075541 RepID=A0ABU2L2B9_9ACTN|nr:HAMP domain-containing sensor histidine kinase [Streptomyces sp. DSM 44917]MDT0305546.1 HAMP domain-containing sensor histidine kinase [Streptomyces sp. DSM 44917]